MVAGMFSSVCLATPLWAAMSASFDRTREKYSKRNSVIYDKKEDEEELVLATASTGNAVATANTPKQAGQKQNKGKVVYKYSKKNTTFKKK